MPTTPQVVNILGELQASRLPAWYQFKTTEFAGAPNAADDGAALGPSITNGSPAARVLVQMREEVWHRVARVTVSTRDASADYTITIAGTGIATTSGSFATDDALLVELKAKIDADATVGQAASTPLVDSELLDSNGDVTTGTAAGGNAAVTLRIFGEGDADFTLAGSNTGTGVLACKADPTSAVARIWLTARGSAVDNSETAPNTLSWAQADSGNKTLDYRGLALNLDVGGWERCYVELDDVAAGSDTSSAAFVITYTDANGPIVYLGFASRETSD